MGVMYKAFTFDGELSSDYDIYLTGEGVFNAPERAVEMVNIPGRNGAFAMDLGRFENVEITYKAAITGLNESNFSDKVAAARNWLCSKVGYCRLEDDYNASEYRMALYKSGLEVEHELLTGGEFELTFDCKPQRWLKSGETAETVPDGGTVTNPTLFDAAPLLAVKGYGAIDLDGYELTVNDATFGDLYVVDGDNWTTTKTYKIEPETVNNGDAFSVSGAFNLRIGNDSITIAGAIVSDSNASFDSALSEWSRIMPAYTVVSQLTSNFNCAFTIGTDKTETNTATITFTSAIPYGTATYTVTQKIQYIAADNKITVTETATCSTTGGITLAFADNESGTTTIVVQSTASVLGDPTFIDCDLGECYRVLLSGKLLTLNYVVDFGSDLPKLTPGAHTINYDNTVTELKIAPRWWRV